MKINKKQKLIMKIFGTFLFALALVLILDLAFGISKKINKDYVGNWKIGYKFYESKTEKNLLYTFEQELHLLKDGTFYTKEVTTPDNGSNNYVSGTYTVFENKVTLVYDQNGKEKTNILILKDNKLCLTTTCEKYYSLNKVEKYYPMYKTSIGKE